MKRNSSPACGITAITDGGQQWAREGAQGAGSRDGYQLCLTTKSTQRSGGLFFENPLDYQLYSTGGVSGPDLLHWAMRTIQML